MDDVVGNLELISNASSGRLLFADIALNCDFVVIFGFIPDFRSNSSWTAHWMNKNVNAVMARMSLSELDSLYSMAQTLWTYDSNWKVLKEIFGLWFIAARNYGLNH